MEDDLENFWRGKKVLLTGHTGFKGAWMAIWLHQLGASVIGVALPPISELSLFNLAKVYDLVQHNILDIRDEVALTKLVQREMPEVVFHFAAQALVRTSYIDPSTTIGTNVIGTANLLNSLRFIDSIRSVVIVTTDKVYKNLEHFYPYRESDALGGHDPYSASKAAAEILVNSFRDSYLLAKGIGVGSARAGNVIGGGDWSLDRLRPDAIRSWGAQLPLEIRYPKAVRPWQHVLEPLYGYLVLAQKLFYSPNLSGAYNFGPESDGVIAVEELIRLAMRNYGSGSVYIGDQLAAPHEAGLLSLEIVKAKSLLNVFPRWSIEEAVGHTMEWYQLQKKGISALSLCQKDIAKFGELE